MARLVVEGFPDELMHALKVKAANERTTVKALIIAAAEKYPDVVGAVKRMEHLKEGSER